jgi:U-box domain
MQAEEGHDTTPSQPSKAAGLHARKKAAKQQADAAGSKPQPADQAAQPATAFSSAGDEVALLTQSSATAVDVAQPGAAPVVPAAASSMQNSLDGPGLPVQQSKAGWSLPAAESDWWRCPLSGKVMQDPVLHGSGGHSYEREALEQWLAAHPGVDPLSRQPLPPGAGCDMLANHALRSLLQQLQLG